MAFYQTPGTDFHDLNLDWVLNQVKQLTIDWASTREDWEQLRTDTNAFMAAIQADWQFYKNKIDDFFETLDLQDQVDRKLDEMAADGSLLLLISDTVSESAADAAGDWLAEHVTTTEGTTQVDDSLSIAHAAADAAATGVMRDRAGVITITEDMVNTTRYMTSSGVVTASNTNTTKTLVIPCKPNTTYSISKIESPTFRYAWTPTTFDYSNIYIAGFQNPGSTATNVTITTGADARQLLICYYVNNSSSDAGAILASIKVEDLTHKAVDGVFRAQSDRINSAIANTRKLLTGFPAAAFTTSAYEVGWFPASVSVNAGIYQISSTMLASYKLPVGYGIVGTYADTPATQYICRAFAADNTYLGSCSTTTNGDFVSGGSNTSNPINVDKVTAVYPTAASVVMQLKRIDGENISTDDVDIGFTASKINFTGIDMDAYYKQDRVLPYSSNEITFTYDIGGGYTTKGFLLLPPDYETRTNKIPLVVFCHGSGDITSINATTMTTHYMDYYGYIRDCGYAVFDCYAFSSKYGTDVGQNTWGIPINDRCYYSGIRYLANNYKIDLDNVFVSCKSLGGIQALKMLMDPAAPVKAVGMLAPELWYLKMKMGYTAIQRQIIAQELGFTEDTGDVLDFDNTEPIPEGFYDYITENIPNWCGVFANYTGLDITNANKPDYYTHGNSISTMAKHTPGRPLKIWIAPDDSNVTYSYSAALVSAIQNAGGEAHLRSMPENTGGHHSVDNDENAPQTTNVTTPLGITYASVPTAYYELVEFFNQYLSSN